MSKDISVYTDTGTDTAGKVNFILGLYESDDFTEEQRKEIYEMRIEIIDAVVKYFNQVIDSDKQQPDPTRISKVKEYIKSQLLEVIQKQHEMYNKMDEILHLVWDQLKECLNYHISKDLRLKGKQKNTTAMHNSSFFRTDWTNCCPDDLKEIARILAINLCKKQLIDDVEHLTHNIRIACSVVISYYLIQLEWGDEISLVPLRMKGPSDWIVPNEWKSKKYPNIIPFTVMCWINERFVFDDTYKQRMVDIINGFIVGIASKGTYDNIDLSKYHKMIVSSGEFVHNDSDRQDDISLAVRNAMLNDQQMAAQSLENEEKRQPRGGKRNRNTRTRTRVSSQRNITKYKRAKTGKHKRINYSKYKRINSSKYKRTI